MTLPRLVLVFCAAVFAGFGLAFLLAPSVLGGFVDVILPTPTARADFRATYGGFELGFGAFLALCAARRECVRLGLLASGLCLLGFAAGRALSLLLDGAPRRIVLLLLAAELAGSALSFLAAGWSAGVAGDPGGSHALSPSSSQTTEKS